MAQQVARRPMLPAVAWVFPPPVLWQAPQAVPMVAGSEAAMVAWAARMVARKVGTEVMARVVEVVEVESMAAR